MEIRYIPGDDLAFRAFVKAKGVGKHAHLRAFEGKFRWVIDDEAEEYIARPESANNQ